MSGGQAKTKKEGEQEEKESATLAAAATTVEHTTEKERSVPCTPKRFRLPAFRSVAEGAAEGLAWPTLRLGNKQPPNN